MEIAWDKVRAVLDWMDLTFMRNAKCTSGVAGGTEVHVSLKYAWRVGAKTRARLQTDDICHEGWLIRVQNVQ